MEIRGEVSAIARAGALAPVQKRLRPHRAADVEIRGEVSASVRGGGGAPPPVKSACGHTEPRTWKSAARGQRQFAAGGGAPRPEKKPAATPPPGHGKPPRGGLRR